MLYLFETELPANKSIMFSLQYIFGIGKFNSKIICDSLGFSVNFKTKDLTKQQTLKLIKKIEELKLIVSSDLKKTQSLNNSKQLSIKSYRGFRKIYGLPSRGQRTHTNAKTARKKL